MQDETQALEAILAVLRSRTGIDFSRYRSATVRRRIHNRMLSIGAESLQEYRARLEACDEEAGSLLERVAIKVSRFYRNRASFDLLRARVLPALAARGKALHVWCAGCGCGEEAYSLAMLLEEAGVEGTVEATDIDPAALEAARRGQYAPEAAAELPDGLAARHLEEVHEGRKRMLRAGAALRGRVRFARHDLLGGAPGRERFDLVSCRNVLIYLQAPVRDQAFATLRGALAPRGFLFLGEAEWPPEPVAATLECLGHGARLFAARPGTR